MVPGWLAPMPRPQGFRQAKVHRAGVPLLAHCACMPARMVPQSLVLGSLDPARHMRAPRFSPAPASALDGQRRAVVVQADAAAHGLLARLLVATPLPVLALAARVAVKHLLATAALLPVLVAGRGASELLAARRASHCVSLTVIRCSDVYCRSRTIARAGGRCAGIGRGCGWCFLCGRACQREGRNASMNLCIAAVGCCACGALAFGGRAFLLRPGETRGCFVAPAHRAPHIKELARRCRSAPLPGCRVVLFFFMNKHITKSSAAALTHHAAFVLGARSLVCTRPRAHGLRRESRHYLWCGRSRAARTTDKGLNADRKFAVYKLVCAFLLLPFVFNNKTFCAVLKDRYFQILLEIVQKPLARCIDWST